jgi:hypothetical protein
MGGWYESEKKNTTGIVLLFGKEKSSIERSITSRVDVIKKANESKDTKSSV